MDSIRFLEFASTIAIVLRVLGVVILVRVLHIQLAQLKNKTKLQPLKKLLITLLIAKIVATLPIIAVNLLRVNGTPNLVFSGIATMLNAAGVLIVGVILYLVYTFREE